MPPPSINQVRGSRLRAGALLLLLGSTVAISTACSSDPSETPSSATPPSSEGSATIGSKGGVVTTADGASIEIPEGALQSDVAITITKLDVTPEFAQSAVYRLAPEGQTFLRPVVLTFPFRPPPSERTEPLVISTTPTGKDEWQSLGGTLIDATHIRATTTHFSDAAATFSPVSWLSSACAQGVMAAGGFNPNDPMFASLRPLDKARVCSGGSRASGYAECKYHCDRCNTSGWLGGFPALLSEINTWSSATLNLGGQASRAVGALGGFAQRVVDMYKEWCIGYRRANPVMGWSAKSWCDAPANLSSFFGGAATVAAYTGIAIACLEALTNAATEVARAVGISGRDYGYLNDAWYESLSLVACSVVNAANTCSSLGAQPTGPAAATTGLQGVTNFVSGNPYFNGATLACNTAVACRNDALCQVTEKACAYYDQVATRPAPGFTPETDYNKDNWCCCRSANGDVNAASTWSVTEEHRCIDTGKTFFPGTCGPQAAASRVEQGLPTDAAGCVAHARGPTPVVTGNAWGTMSCVNKVTGQNCIGYTIGHCADESAYGSACSDPGNPGGPVLGPSVCSQDEGSTTYRCLHSWCAYGCVPGNSPPGTHDDNWVPVYTCTDSAVCD